MAPTLALAGVSVRLLAERAVRDGYAAIALDGFGDIDTRAAARWRSIAGADGPLAIDGDALLDALRDVAGPAGAIGWIAGSGFESRPELLERGAALLPLLGCAAALQRRLRAPRPFFERLDALGVAHPEVRHTPPPAPAGWLRKDGGGHGGWHVRRAAAQEPPLEALEYFQREAPGTPMSATFVAAGGQARVLGINEMLVRRFGGRPFVHAGCIGPLPLSARAAQAVEAAVAALARDFALHGLASLDFILDGEALAVLEVNARPSASLALYGDGWLRAHVQACVEGRLPPSARREGDAVRGTEIVYAPRAFVLRAEHAERLAATAHCHDLPHSGTRFAYGDPVCSVDAGAAEVPAVKALLAERRAAIEQLAEATRS